MNNLNRNQSKSSSPLEINLLEAFIDENKKLPILNSDIIIDRTKIPSHFEVIEQNNPWFQALNGMIPRLEELLDDTEETESQEHSPVKYISGNYSVKNVVQNSSFKINVPEIKQPIYSHTLLSHGMNYNIQIPNIFRYQNLSVLFPNTFNMQYFSSSRINREQTLARHPLKRKDYYI